MKTGSTLRLPPQDLMAEEAILGGMLINPSCRPRVTNIINREHFWREAHQYIFDAICEVGPDLVLMVGWLTKNGLLEKVGGLGNINEIIARTGTSVGIEQYCYRIKELAAKRWFIGQCSNAIENTFQETKSFDDIVSMHKINIVNHASQSSSATYTNPRQMKIDLIHQIETASKGHQNWIRTGFDNIDKNLLGLEPTCVTGIIARPGQGKTALALNISDNVAMDSKNKVLFFSLESNAIALMRRRLSSFSHVFLSRIRAGDLGDGEWNRITTALSHVPENLIIFESSRFKTIENLSNMAETLALESPIDLIIIDHLQKMNTIEKTYSRHNEVSKISNKITSLAKDVKAHVLVLCQLNRESERGIISRAPILSDVKESGDVEADMDNVISLYRKDRKDELTHVEGLKGRDVGTWKTYLKFNRFIQQFSDTDEEAAREMV